MSETDDISEIDKREDGAGSDYERIDEEEEDTEEIAIDVNSGERISLEAKIADNQEDSEAGPTTDTVVFEVEGETLTTNQILMGILDALNTRNKLAQETNKRLRDQNKILRRMAGLTGPTDKTIQGTPPKPNNMVTHSTGRISPNDKSIGFPE